MTSSVIRCLKNQLNATIHFATKKAFGSILENNPYVDQVFQLEKDWKSFVQPMKEESYDHIIDLHNNLRSKRLSRALGLKARKINKLSLQKEALIRFNINHLPDIHFAHRGLETVLHLGVHDDHEGMDFFIPTDISIEGRWNQTPFITLALATAHETKNIPKRTIEKLIQQSERPVILLGGPNEKALGAALEQQFKDKAFNMAGNCSLLESAAYIRQSEYLIAGDTGLLHIAAALKKETISIWGATIPEFGVFPYYGQYEIQHYIHEVKLSCRPCSKHGGASCPKKHFNCMNLQNIESIQEHMDVLTKTSNIE